MPSQEASNLQILSGLQAQLQNEQDTLNTAKQQRAYLQTLIEQYRTLHHLDGSVDSHTNKRPGNRSTQAKLADLRSRYTDHYPEVESLKDEIAKAENARDTANADPKTRGNSIRESNRSDASRSPASLQLQGQLQANQVEIANREQSIAGSESESQWYQNRLNTEPASEEQLADLTRGYDQSKANYDDLLKKRNESEMATSMEHMQQGERFSILDPPSLPLKPDFPNRLKFCAIGLGLGFVFGTQLSSVLEAMDDRLHSDREIKLLLPMPILSEIPAIVSPSDARRR